MDIGQGSVFRKTDPCLYLFELSPDVLKKTTRVLDISNTTKKSFIKMSSGDMDKDSFS